MTPVELAKGFKRLNQEIDLMKRAKLEAMALCRTEGYTWRQISAALNVSHQLLCRDYGKLLEEKKDVQVK